MGRLAIILVTAMGIYLARGYASSNETSYHSTMKQVEHAEFMLAREIARTGFNMAMGMLRSYGDDLQAGVQAVNGASGYVEGVYQGGTYRAYARYTSGHSVEVVSVGYFGGAFTQTNTASAYSTDDPCEAYDGGSCHKMDDVYEYTLPTRPLNVKEPSVLSVTFLESMAGYCSAIYLERYDAEGTSLGDPEMVFPAGKNRDGAALTFSDTLDAGTQMNFFLAVDKNCSTGQDWASFTPMPFNEHDYDHVHYALVGEVTELINLEETVWSLIEQHPDDNQRWRIGWEDQHRTNWDNATSTDPRNSFQALKAYGYDGNGWPTTNAWGYRTLQDHGSRPDFSDQVIEIGLTRIEHTSSETESGGETPEEETGSGPEAEEPGGGETGSETEDPGSDDSESDDSEDTEIDSEEIGTCACATENKKKVYIRHFTNSQRNPYNDICISANALPHHLENHNDHVLCRAD